MISDKPKKSELYWIFALILNQRKLVYNQCSVFKYYLKCLCCRKQSTLKKMKSGGKKDYLVNKGIKKLEVDLDIVNILEMIKRARVLVNLTLTKDENLLLKSQRNDVIDSTDDEDGGNPSSEDGSEELDQLQLMYRNLNRIFAVDGVEVIDESQKRDFRKVLNRYEGREINQAQFRIL